ncbi:MAG: ComEC/Rec2 family competence protein [Christensenellaceae bacterium]
MRKLVNIRPLVLVAVALICVVASYYFALSAGFCLVIVCHLSIVFITAILLFKNFSVFNLIFAALALILIISVSLRCLYIINEYAYYQSFSQEGAVLSGTVKSVSPTAYPERFITTFENVTINGQGVDFNVSGFLDGEYLKGQVAEFECTLTSCDGRLKYSLSGGVVLEFSSVKNFELISAKTGIFTNISNGIKTLFRTNLSDDYDFAVALLLGDTQYIPDELLTNFRYSGIAHIFAVSGLHIGFLCGVAGFICEALYIKYFKKCVIVTLIAIIYAGICGFSVSAQRAVVMCFWLLFCKSFGRYYDNLNAIALACITVVIINPMSVLTEGFILSFSCILSIALFRPTFLDVLKKTALPMKETLSVALSVLFGVTPITCYLFNYLSALSSLLNIVFIPIVSVLYVMLFTSVFLAFIKAALPLKIVGVGIGLIKQLFSMTDFSKFVLFAQITPLTLAVYYVIALFASDFVNIKSDKKHKIIVVLFLAMGLIAL